VLISGSGFTPDTVVHFGPTPASAVNVLSGNYLIATAPPNGAGTANVSVTTPSGTSAPGPGTSVSYTSNPAPCLPFIGGGLSTGLAY
jgi:hypothetical protein